MHAPLRPILMLLVLCVLASTGAATSRAAAPTAAAGSTARAAAKLDQAIRKARTARVAGCRRSATAADRRRCLQLKKRERALVEQRRRLVRRAPAVAGVEASGSPRTSVGASVPAPPSSPAAEPTPTPTPTQPQPQPQPIDEGPEPTPTHDAATEPAPALAPPSVPTPPVVTTSAAPASTPPAAAVLPTSPADDATVQALPSLVTVPAAPTPEPPSASPSASPSTPDVTTRTTLYVDPAGDDTAAGTSDAPLATLTEALRRATGGELVVLAAGEYPAATDASPRSTRVDVRGPGGGAVRIAGLRIRGGQSLDISGVTFTGAVSAQYHDTLRLAQPARDLTFSDVEFTNPAGACVGARNAVTDFVITRSWIHDCTSGFAAGAGGAIPQSSGLEISHSTLEHFTSDAIQLGQWDDVRIEDDVIRDVRDPQGTIHNDGVQLTGNVHGFTLARNRISDARTQLVFLEDAVGPIDDAVVEDNVLWGAGAVAMQSQGVTNARIANNTIWGNRDGGLWLTAGNARADGSRTVPTDTVVVNNLAQTSSLLSGATPATSYGNVRGCINGQRSGTSGGGWTCLKDAEIGFVDLVGGDYRLTPDARARALAGPGGTSVDVDGEPRSAPAPGAFG